MAIGPGSRLGPYEITALLGEGGMGKVWRAHHTGLKRDDALKVLPDAFASDPERLARFQREAQVLASLNHSNIARVYGLEQSDGVQALVMELVEGPTLADRIAQGPIPVDEALPIAKQIAEALEAAHEQGIIHRDLKPANIKVRPDGTVKVLDFGLAKALEPATGRHIDATASPTITSPAMMTGVGVLLGTAAYMSPEQARGKPADKRSDIWAFGCVLFEMLAGKRAFDGENVTDTLAAVLRGEPAWSALPNDVPPAVFALIRGCLRKVPHTRIADVAAALFALEPDVRSIGFRPDVASRLERGHDVRMRRVATYGGIVVVVASLSTSTFWYVTRPEAARVFRSQIITAGSTALSVQGNDTDLAITPDGSRIIYRGINNQLLVRAIDQIEPATLTGVGAPRNVFVSPDSQWIGFFDGSALLKRVAVTGGPPTTITKVGLGTSRGASWGPDDTIVFATTANDTGLMRVAATGGQSTILTRPNRGGGEADHVWPEFLPDGRALLFTILPASGGLDNAQVAVLDLATGAHHAVIRGGHHARYVPSGHIVYGSGGVLHAVAFDLGRLEVIGTPVPVLESVLTAASGLVDAAVSQNGTLVYVPGGKGAGAARSLVWVTREGREEPVPAPLREYDSFQLSPDDSRLAIQINDQEFDVWVWDFDRRTLTRLTFSAELDFDPAWTPDGRRIIFVRGGQAGLFVRTADGTGTEEQLTAMSGITPTSFTPDGQMIILTVQGDLGLLPIEGRREVKPLFRTTFAEGRASLSPDGRWLAYQSNESGEDQIYVQPFPEVGHGRWQVSPAGGTEPAWKRDGRELFYLDAAGALASVPIRTQPSFTVGNPTKLFDAPYFAVSGTRRYDVAVDGQRFLFIKNAAEGSTSRSLVVIQNWDQELKRLVPTN